MEDRDAAADSSVRPNITDVEAAYPRSGAGGSDHAQPEAATELQPGADGAPSDPRPAAQQHGGDATLPFLDQINLLHTALFGWPCDHLTPLDEYLACWDIHQVAVRMLDSARFRWDIRDKVGLWPHDKWVMTEFRGFRLWVNLHDGFVSFGVLHGEWEDAEVDFMVSCLRPGDGMIDAGANIGVYTVQAAAAVGETGKVYAFEPNTTVHEMLTRSIRENGLEARCVLHNEGLGASESAGSFHLSRHATNPGSSHISTGHEGAPIRIRPIDSLVYERPVRFIKMDVEGFEPYVIHGAKQTLARYRPVILTEFFPRSLIAIGNMSGPAYVALLEELGYRMSVFAAKGEGERVTASDASRFDDIVEPVNLVCRPVEAAAGSAG